VTGDRCTAGSASQRITVGKSQPTASCVFASTKPVVDTAVRFDASRLKVGVPGRSVVAFDRVFGDEEFGAGRLVSYSYSFASTFAVTLVVTDGVGKQVTSSQVVTLGGSSAIPVASFTVSPSLTTVGSTVPVDAAASRASLDRAFARHDWYSGDTDDHFTCAGNGTCGNENWMFSQVYTAVGIHASTMTVTDDSGLLSTATVSTVVNWRG